MAHPLIWPSKYFFYAIGNTSAVSVTIDLPPEEPARILLLGCGDPRNVLYTVFTEPLNAERLLDFTCCDIDPAILARNVLLFTLIADGAPDAETWNIFFHFKLDAKSHALLIEQCTKLVDLAETPEKWRESSYGNTLKMCTDYTLAEIKRHWELYLAMRDLPAERRNAINQEFVAIWRNNTNNRYCSTAWRSLGPVMVEGMVILDDSLQHYWKTGTTFRDGKNIAAATILNPTFVYSLAGEGCSVHYATDPLTPFHLAPIFAGAKPNPTTLEVIKGVKSQFSSWCSAYRKTLSSSFTPIIRSFLGEATAVCHAIRVFANSGALNPGIPVAQWKTQLIQFNKWEYVDSPAPAPTDFNVIHTSNLEDHIGLLNVLIPASPLLSPTPSSVLYTESLLCVGNDATKEFIEHLHGDITIMGLILGVCPVDYLSGFTSRSNTHELMSMQTSTKGTAKGKKSKDKSKSETIEGGISQFQQLVTWKAPTSCDPIASQLPVPRPSYDPFQMSTFLYDMYQSLYATESAMNFWDQNQANPLRALQTSNITTHYTREAFVLLLKIIKDRLQPTDDEWRTTVEGFNERLLSTWSKMNMETMHYQDMCGHLVRYGLYRAQCFEPRARKMGPFAAWPTIPDLIRIVLVIPRSGLWVLEGEDPDEIGTPPLQCDITGVNCSNLFTSVHAAFGRAISFGTPANPQVRFEEDLKGWKGKSPLVVSFTAPSYLLTELEPYQNLTVNFAVRNTPAACLVLVKKLGLQLRIFSAKLMDSSLVHILPEPPLPARRRNPGPPSPHPQPVSTLTQIGEAGRSVIQLNEDCEEVSTLGIRISLTDEKSVQLFSSEGSKVVPELEQISACVIRVKLGERTQDLAYPFPVMGSQHRLRLARKSRYIEVLVPPSRAFALEGMKLNPYPVIRNGSTMSPWSIHRVSISKMPAVNLSAKGLAQWLNPHVGSMMSKREKSMRKKHKHDALMYVKDTIHSIMVGASGIQNGPPRRLFSLSDEKTNNSDTVIFINDFRFDLASHTVVCDGYVLPLTKAFLMSVETPFAKLVTQGNLATIPVFDGEMQSWKQLLPSLVERCRTSWTHGPNCEYLSQGRIPLTEEMEENPLCSCGIGKDVEGMQKVDLWKPFAPYVTRIAISPLFAVSYLETVGGSHEPRKCSVCRGKGKPSLKACSGCKKPHELTMVKNIVIVGGGSAGVFVAKELAAKIDGSKNRIILISASHRFVHLPSTLRAATTSEGQLENESFMEYGTNFLKGKGEVKHATVTSFTAGTPGQVKLSTGETVDYEVLLLATGNIWTGPAAIPATSQEEVKKHLDLWRGRIEKAKSIVLVGGGIVGAELAGEISHFYKGKPITIVHSEELPLNPVYPDKVRRKLLNGLQKHGITFVGKDRVENFTPSEDGQVTTKNGKVINADLVITTIGGTPNTGFIAESLGADVLSASKHVRVLPTLQLPNHSNIFALGDIIDWQEQRQAAKIPAHASVVAKNVLSLLDDRAATAEYKGSPEITIITLGPTDGVTYLGFWWGIVLGGWFSAMMKSKTLMIPMAKASFA